MTSKYIEAIARAHRLAARDQAFLEAQACQEAIKVAAQLLEGASVEACFAARPHVKVLEARMCEAFARFSAKEEAA